MRPGLPPGPAAGRLAQTVALHRDPLRFLRGLRDRHGDVFTIRLLTAGPQVVLTTPEAIGLLGVGDPGRADAGAARRGVLPQASPESVFGASGATHDAARRRLEPAFAPEAIAALAPAIEALADRHAPALPAGRPFRLLPRMRAFADDVFVRCLLGVRDEARAAALAAAIGALLWTPGNPPVTIPGPQDGLAGRALARLFARRRARVAGLLRAELAERARAGAAGDGDLLERVRRDRPQADADAIVDELLAVIMAGQEPAAAALTWTALRRAHDPGTPVDEALHAHPPALAMLRRLREPVRVDGHHLPAGTGTLLPIALLHDRTERSWAFGAGARQCIAQPLARAELAAMLPRLDGLRPALPRMEAAVLRATILVPRRSGLVSGPRRAPAARPASSAPAASAAAR